VLVDALGVGRKGRLQLLTRVLQLLYGSKNCGPDRSEECYRPSDMRTGALTVGPSGRFVFLTSEDQGLLLIDTQTGEPCAARADCQAVGKSLARRGLLAKMAATVVTEQAKTLRTSEMGGVL